MKHITWKLKKGLNYFTCGVESSSRSYFVESYLSLRIAYHFHHRVNESDRPIEQYLE